MPERSSDAGFQIGKRPSLKHWWSLPGKPERPLNLVIQTFTVAQVQSTFLRGAQHTLVGRLLHLGGAGGAWVDGNLLYAKLHN